MAVDVQSGLTLRLKYVQDRELHYNIKTSVAQEMIDKGTTLGKEQNAFEAEMIQRVLRVEPDGSGHVITSSRPIGAAAPAPVPGAPNREVSYSHLGAQGEVLEISGFNPGSSYAFPDGAVKVGGAWQGSTRLQIPTRPEPIDGVNRFKLLGSEQVNGYDCVKIEVKADKRSFQVALPDGSGVALVEIESEGAMWFAPAEGFLVKLDMLTLSKPTIGESTFDTKNRLVQELVKIEQP
ncbi:MAG: hypothetical protein HY319_29580 [Armatimonadetes bacterium]|nr:hypothetical protein [Armatimonadota bacterium]